MKKIINKVMAFRKMFYNWIDAQPCTVLTNGGLI